MEEMTSRKREGRVRRARTRLQVQPWPIDHYERQLHAEGFQLVAGVDEAGRGALAGPLVAAAVILPEPFDCDGLADSKLLSPAQREDWFARIRAVAVSVAVCRAYPRRIDHRGLHV